MEKASRLDIKRLQHLFKLLGTTQDEIQAISARIDAQEALPFGVAQAKDLIYREKIITSPSGKERPVAYNCGRLREIQTRIKTSLYRVRLSECMFGCYPKRSARDNARRHTHKEVVITCDIRNFFPSIRENKVLATFRDRLKCRPPVAKILTRLTTYRGHLHQGLPTSQIVAAFALEGAATRIANLMQERGGVGTIYVDDIAVSGPTKIRSAVPKIEQIITSQQLELHPDKTRIMGSDQQQIVTGFLVNNGIDSSSDFRLSCDKLLRDVEYQAEHFGVVVAKEILALNGKLNAMGQRNRGTARQLRKRLLSAIAGSTQVNDDWCKKAGQKGALNALLKEAGHYSVEDFLATV